MWINYDDLKSAFISVCVAPVIMIEPEINVQVFTALEPAATEPKDTNFLEAAKWFYMGHLCSIKCT